MGYSTGDCKARSCLWLACKHRENSAFEFFDQTGCPAARQPEQRSRWDAEHAGGGEPPRGSACERPAALGWEAVDVGDFCISPQLCSAQHSRGYVVSADFLSQGMFL